MKLKRKEKEEILKNARKMSSWDSKRFGSLTNQEIINVLMVAKRGNENISIELIDGTVVNSLVDDEEALYHKLHGMSKNKYEIWDAKMKLERERQADKDERKRQKWLKSLAPKIQQIKNAIDVEDVAKLKTFYKKFDKKEPYLSCGMLIEAIKAGKPNAVSAILQSHAPSETDIFIDFEHDTKQIHSPLWEAISCFDTDSVENSRKHFEVIKQLAPHFDLNYKESGDMSLLMQAVCPLVPGIRTNKEEIDAITETKMDVAHFLLEKGAKVDAEDKLGRTVLSYTNDWRVFADLVENYGARISEADLTQPSMFPNPALEQLKEIYKDPNKFFELNDEELKTKNARNYQYAALKGLYDKKEFSQEYLSHFETRMETRVKQANNKSSNINEVQSAKEEFQPTKETEKIEKAVEKEPEKETSEDFLETNKNEISWGTGADISKEFNPNYGEEVVNRLMMRGTCSYSAEENVVEDAIRQQILNIAGAGLLLYGEDFGKDPEKIKEFINGHANGFKLDDFKVEHFNEAVIQERMNENGTIQRSVLNSKEITTDREMMI